MNHDSTIIAQNQPLLTIIDNHDVVIHSVSFPTFSFWDSATGHDWGRPPAVGTHLIDVIGPLGLYHYPNLKDCYLSV